MLEPIAIVALMALGLAYSGATLAGPFGLSTWLKRRVLNSSAPTWLKTGIECVYCWSFWLTLGTALALVGVGEPSLLLQVWLAAFGLTTVVFLWAGQ
jgi:hypothetical protein